MLYKQNINKKLSNELFKNPTSEYRGTPFWAWNCELNEDMLLEQIDILESMGFGGFHMHVRTGLATDYLSEEYMNLVKQCINKAKAKKMLAWLYDEDRWPSGAAGGLVTKDPQYRSRYLVFTPKSYEDEASFGEDIKSSSAANKKTGNGKLLGCYDIILDKDGSLKSWSSMDIKDNSVGQKWYAYIETPSESPWYNNQTYVNTLDKKAIDKFIEITHENYKKNFSDDFGDTVPAIFTDEPQFPHKTTLSFSSSLEDVTLPWSDDLAETFQNTYGENLIENLPQLIWELPEDQVSTVRYHYHDHIAERFAQAFADNCGRWCRENGIMLTGHMMEEPTLKSQTAALGEAMRSYRGFDLPGIDMLCNWYEFNTAKQAQSASHQFGCEGVLSELYGVTGWDFDFRGHKLQGDWQAALGVTVRVPHLSWVSMAGEAKRDYPASINYQSPWYTEYPFIEDHFARVNTAMTRGKAIVKVGVIHPVESYWLHWGPSEQTELIREQLDTNFHNLTNWLLFGAVDFDFICESLLPIQCETGSAPLAVGKMEYDVILVPSCETLRSTTVERLIAFSSQGGKLIFMGEAPKLVDAIQSDDAKALYNKSYAIPFEKAALLKSLEDYRTVEIRQLDGRYTNNLIYQMRQDEDCRWLFVAHASEPYNKDLATKQSIRIKLKGCFSPKLFNTLDGTTRKMDYSCDGRSTSITCDLYDYDSLLICLEAGQATDKADKAEKNNSSKGMIEIPYKVPVTLHEDNAMLLDMAEYNLDRSTYKPVEEILRLDNILRKQLNWATREEAVAQPWTLEKDKAHHQVSLRFMINSLVNIEHISLAIEDAEKVQIIFNGEEVESVISGWYVDKSIKTVSLGRLHYGENILEVHIPFSKRSNLEWCYLVGNFGVKVSGREKVITEPVTALNFADITQQGLPFYGGNITYHVDFQSEDKSISVAIPNYRGALLKVNLDGKKIGKVVLPPYKVITNTLVKGKHRMDITFFGNRYNTFGQVHLADSKFLWLGPNSWRTKGYAWCYEYVLKTTGILSSPVIEIL